MKISTKPDVYEPVEDSYLLINALRHAGDLDKLTLCDVGCGTGTIGLHAAEQGAVVTLVDVNPSAIALSRKNAEQNNLPVRVVESDFFSNVPDKFDIIVSNPPYLPADKREEDDALTRSISGGKHGYEWTVRFLEEAKEHLQPKGVLLFTASSYSKPQVLEEHIERCGFSWSIVSQQQMGGFEELRIYLCRFLPGLIDARVLGCKDITLHAKGKRGLVFSGKHEGKKVAIKVNRPGATQTLENESKMLLKVNEQGIGPRLLYHSSQCVVMEFIEGPFLHVAFPLVDKQRQVALLQDLLRQALLLDKMGIDKHEFTRPYRNAIVREDKVILIDFERAKFADRPSNVSQVVQFVLRSLPEDATIEGRDIVSQYKHTYDDGEIVIAKILDIFKKHG